MAPTFIQCIVFTTKMEFMSYKTKLMTGMKVQHLVWWFWCSDFTRPLAWCSPHTKYDLVRDYGFILWPRVFPLCNTWWLIQSTIRTCREPIKSTWNHEYVMRIGPSSTFNFTCPIFIYMYMWVCIHSGGFGLPEQEIRMICRRPFQLPWTCVCYYFRISTISSAWFWFLLNDKISSWHYCHMSSFRRPSRIEMRCDFCYS